VLGVKLFNNHSSKGVCPDTSLEEVGLSLRHLSMLRGYLGIMVSLKLDHQVIFRPKSKM
jgi:hypothetical protein